ncbi:MAG: helix-turn-helix domain-containing protein [Candidatus Omnitrophota bacterium]|nr:helix-turn-helix domain-containing protein [Candidatus Omnitrophota bacterium]
MDNPVDNKNKEESPVFKIIQEIKDKTRDAKDMPKESRQECVETLYSEGYSVSQIAQLLDRSEKTIKRDIQDIRQRGSVRPSVELAAQLVGDMLKKLEVCHSYLVRIAHSKEGSLQEKSQAVYYASKIITEMTERLQTLGYLPSAPQKVIGDIYHHNDCDDKSIAEAKEKLKEIEKIAQETGALDEDTKKRIELLKTKIEKTEIVKEVEDLGKDQNSKNKEETKNE